MSQFKDEVARQEGGTVRRSAGIALTAAALSVTLGILIGAVITIGTDARTHSLTPPAAASTTASASRPDPTSDDSAPSSSQDAQSTDPVPTSPVPSSPVPTSPVPTSPVPTSPVPSSPVPTSPVPTSPVTSKQTRTSTARATPPSPKTTQSSPRPAVITTLTVVAATRAAPSTSSSSTLTTSTSGSTANTPRTPTAGQPCSVLGEKATAADGSTVFCQRNFAVTGALAWRAVINGGGCLNRRMTGQGADGQNYVCRADATGADHWRRAP